MIRKVFISAFISSAAIAALLSMGCSAQPTSAAEPAAPLPVAVRVTAVQSQAIDRFLRVTGSLAADEQAEVAAETGGRVIATPVERGTRVSAGAVLIRVSGEDLVVHLHEMLPLLHLDDGIRGVTSEATRSLVDHDPAMW